MVGLDDLRKTLLSERETGRLTKIPQDLFERTHTAVLALLTRIYAIEDPLSDEARSLIEETMSIRETAHDIFIIRTKKILALAESQAQGYYIDREEMKKMIPPEREMFDRIADAIDTCKGVLVHSVNQSLPLQHESPSTGSQDQPLPHETPTASAPTPVSLQYSLVRVLTDMEAFMGVDGKIYTLAQGDIVTLPERNAEVLVGRNIALNMNLSK
jgi:DNA replication factor GINS